MDTYKPVFRVLTDDIFTNREDLLRILKDVALNAKLQRNISRVLIGHRRVGKTEVLKRLYNELFWEQDEVVPIYITFEELSRETRRFASEYIGAFIRQYVGFKLKDAKLAGNTGGLDEIIKYVHEYTESQQNRGLLWLLENYSSAVTDSKFAFPVLSCAIQAPRRISDENEEPMFVMLDEFQHVIEIRNEDGTDPNALGRYQYAVESRLCPHLVTGSAVTLLTKDIIGRGSLFGRFRAEYIRGLEGYHVIELCQKLGKHHDVKVSVEMAAELARRTGGNPFYLGCIFEGTRLIGVDLEDFNAVNRVITYELTQGAIWSELYRQLNYYFNTINEHGITKNIFYFATRYRDEKIDPKRIAESMAHWGVNEQDIRDILLSLSRADLIDERVAGTEFYNIKDPILREFADAWALVDVEGEEWAAVEAEFQRRYMQLRGEYADFKGYTGEIYVQFLMTKFNFQSVDGAEYFNVDGQILLPKFTGPDSKKVKTPTSREYQIDVVGMYGLTFWLVEVKYTDQSVDKSDVEKFEAACQVAKEMYEEKDKRNLPPEEDDILPLEFVKWYVSIGGFTQPAIEYLQAHNFLYSDRAQINKLLRNFGLRELPL